MLRSTSAPIYRHLPPGSTPVLHHLRRHKVANDATTPSQPVAAAQRPRTHKHTHVPRRRPRNPVPLPLNVLLPRALRTALERYAGLSDKHAEAVVAARETGGDFLAPHDLERRVSGLRAAHMQAALSLHGLALNFSPSPSPSPSSSPSSSPSRPRPPSPVPGPGPLSYSTPPQLPAHTKRSASRMRMPATLHSDQGDDATLTIVTWNAARLTPRKPASFAAKLAQLRRLIADAAPDLICLQEVCVGAAEASVASLNDCDDGDGKRVSDSATGRRDRSTRRWGVAPSPHGDASLAILFRRSRVRVRATDDPDMPYAFTRPPQLVVATLRGVRSRGGSDGKGGDGPADPAGARRREERRGGGHRWGLVIAHVHLRQSGPADEICALAGVAQRLSAAQRLRCSVCVVGDLNVAPTEACCEALRRAALVETVAPRGASAHTQAQTQARHGWPVVAADTTVGGRCIDNVWIDEAARVAVTQAWTFGFGGRGQALEQSATAFAAQRRARSGDHLAVVVRVDMAAAEKLMAGPNADGSPTRITEM